MKSLMFSMVSVLICALIIQAQEDPIEFSPFIGEKLDKVERDYFHLFEDISGFQEAVFFLNPDSTLRVKINYETKGQQKDTVLNNYKSPRKMKNYIDQFLTYVVNDIDYQFRGRYGDVLLIDSSTVSGELLAVRDSSVLVYGMSEESYKSREIVLFNINNINGNDIRNVSFTSKTNISMLIFVITGMVAGSIIGSAIVKPESEDSFWEKAFNISFDLGKIGGFWAGMVLGGIVGITLGLLIPIETESETVFEPPFDEKNIEGLRDRSRYQDEVPYYISIIK